MGRGNGSGRLSGNLTQTVVTLRRLAEIEARARLRLLRGQLELCKRREAALVLQVEQAAAHARSSDKAELAVAGPLAAAELGTLRTGLRQHRQLLSRAEAEAAEEATRHDQLLTQIEHAEAQLRTAIARRKAAELHEAEERRSTRRARERQQHALEEEARDRVLTQRSRKT
jgi:hypothetical protein